MYRRIPVARNACREEVRHGTATVELAVVLPIFMTIVLGVAEMSRGLDVSERLASAVRQGAREAASDLTGKVPNGWTINQKVIKDIQNMLTASGLAGDKVEVSITYADGSSAGAPFDFQNPENYLKYFRITATVDYSDIGLFPRILKDKKLKSSVVFRLGRNTTISS